MQLRHDNNRSLSMKMLLCDTEFDYTRNLAYYLFPYTEMECYQLFIDYHSHLFHLNRFVLFWSFNILCYTRFQSSERSVERFEGGAKIPQRKCFLLRQRNDALIEWRRVDRRKATRYFKLCLILDCFEKIQF